MPGTIPKQPAFTRQTLKDVCNKYESVFHSQNSPVNFHLKLTGAISFWKLGVVHGPRSMFCVRLVQDRCFKFWSLKSEVWNLKSEVWSLKSEVWSLKSEVGSLKSEVWSLKSEVWSLKSEVWSPKSEVWSLKSDVWSRKSEVGSPSSAFVEFHSVKDQKFYASHKRSRRTNKNYELFTCANAKKQHDTTEISETH